MDNITPKHRCIPTKDYMLSTQKNQIEIKVNLRTKEFFYPFDSSSVSSNTYTAKVRVLN